MRLALVGHTHWELDVEGCHYAIFLDFLRRYTPLFQLPQAYSSVPLVRQELVDIFASLVNGFPRKSPYAKAHPDYSKKIPTIALNCDSASMIEYMQKLYRLAGAVPTRYTDFLSWVETAKQALWASPAPRPEDPRITTSNQIYFMMEAVEEQLLSGITRNLLEHHAFDSLLWLHDGIWFSPPAPSKLVEHAVETMRQRLQLPTVRVKYSALAQAREDLLRALPLPSGLHAGNKLKLHLYKEQGVYRRVDPGPRPPLASVLRQIKAGHQHKRKFDPTQLTLKAFMERKAKRQRLVINLA
jgi:hypothetical protein